MALPVTHLWVLALAAYSILSLAWSLDPRQGLLQAANIVMLAILYAMAPRLPVRWMGAAAICLVGILWFVVPFGGQGNANFATEFMLIGLPWLIVLPIHRYWKFLGIAIIAAAIFDSGSNAVWPVMLLAGVAAAALRWNRWIWLLAPCLAGTGAFLATNNPFLRGAMLYRLEAIWDSLIAWTHAPLFGHGLGSFVYVYPFFQEAHRWFWGSTAIGEGFIHMGASHNEPSQLLLELGGVGAILALGLLLSLNRKPRTPEQKAALASLGIAGVLSLYGFPLQNPQTACLAALALGLSAGGSMMVPLRRVSQAVALTVAMSPVAILLPWLGATQLHAQFLHGEARRVWEDSPLMAWELSEQAWRISDLDWRIRTHVAISLRHLFDSGVPGRPLSIPEGSADRAWEVAASASPKWIPILYYRAESLAAFGRLSDAYAIIDVLRTFKLQYEVTRFIASFEEQWPIHSGN